MELLEGNHYSLGHSQEALDHQSSHVNDHSQFMSPFFGRLPPEIRHQVYEAILHSAGLTQHIYKSDVGHSAAITHTRCCIDPDDEDVRELRYFETFSEEIDTVFSNDQNNYNQRLWRGRQYTDWCNHWQCEETSETQQLSIFLGATLHAHPHFDYLRTPYLICAPPGSMAGPTFPLTITHTILVGICLRSMSYSIQYLYIGTLTIALILQYSDRFNRSVWLHPAKPSAFLLTIPHTNLVGICPGVCLGLSL